MRRLSLLLALLPLPALAAVPTVTITRTLSAPDGTRPATGTIRATLGPAVGVYLDGQTTVAVSGSATGAIVSGVATITLTPTDVLSPSGLLYAVTIASDKPRLSWSETWQVSSAGAVTRLSVAPGVTVPPVVTYGLDAALSGKPCAVPAVASDTGRIYGCVGGVYSAAAVYASASDVAAHVARTDNPHAVTYAQTGALGATAQAADSARLGGYVPTYFAAAADLTAHASRTDNPHGVTAAQTGALPIGGGTVTGTTTFAQSGTGVGIEVKNTDATAADSRAVRITSGGASPYYWDLVTAASGGLSFRRNGTERAFLDGNGRLYITYASVNSYLTLAPKSSPPVTCSSTNPGTVYVDSSYLPNRVYFCVQIDATPTYGWRYVSLN